MVARSSVSLAAVPHETNWPCLPSAARARFDPRIGSGAEAQFEEIDVAMLYIEEARRKQVVACATGLDRADFTTHQARRLLMRLGFVAARLSRPAPGTAIPAQTGD